MLSFTWAIEIIIESKGWEEEVRKGEHEQLKSIYIHFKKLVNSCFCPLMSMVRWKSRARRKSTYKKVCNITAAHRNATCIVFLYGTLLKTLYWKSTAAFAFKSFSKHLTLAIENNYSLLFFPLLVSFFLLLLCSINSIITFLSFSHKFEMAKKHKIVHT